jgi:hypothetical protein
MMEDPLAELAKEYDRYCQRIEPLAVGYSFQTMPGDDGSPHVEFFDEAFQYIVTERGSELERRSTSDIDEILYWLLSDLTFWMAVKWELANRVDGRDCRRLIFSRQTELLRRASDAVSGRRERQIAATLAENPFIDR